MSKTMFDIIKKQNGERFAKAIRNYDSGIFDIPNLDEIVKYAGRQAEPILKYLVSIKDIKIKEQAVHQDPIKLLSQAGYNAYVADTLEKQNEIKKYFIPREELCTFRDPHRYEGYYIVNAVRKDVDKIRRENFKTPQREDEYGTSVISIQILKSGGFISIKNRYNHSVENGDNTFNSNPDNIIDGLSDALKSYFDVDFSSQKVTLPKGYTVINDCIIKYNYERNNIYVGNGFYVKDGVIFDIDKNSEILLDTVLLNFKYHSVENVTDIDAYSERSLLHLWQKLINDKKLSIQKNLDGTKSLYANERKIAVLKDSKIIELDLTGITEIKHISGIFGESIQKLDIPDVEVLPSNFLNYNKELLYLNAPKLKKMGERCFYFAEFLKKLDLPSLEEMEANCFSYADALEELNAPKLKKIGSYCFSRNKGLSKLDLPSVEVIGDICFVDNEKISELNAPNLKILGRECFCNNKELRNLYLKSLEKISYRCFFENEIMENLIAPNLKEMDSECFYKNTGLRSLSLPTLITMGERCFSYNKDLSKLNLSNLREMGSTCFDSNLGLNILDLPLLEKMGSFCFGYNEDLSILNAPNLRTMDRYCFNANKNLKILNLQSLKVMNTGCFSKNEKITGYLKRLFSYGSTENIPEGGLVINLHNVNKATHRPEHIR